MSKPNPITKVSTANCAEVIKDLRTFIAEDLLPARDHSFANDLISGKYGFDKRGYLSQGQMDWVGVLTDRALGLEIVPTTTEVGNLEGLVELFEQVCYLPVALGGGGGVQMDVQAFFTVVGPEIGGGVE